MDSLQDGAAGVESFAQLSRFRVDFHACLAARADELCELADAVLCADGPVRNLAELSLVAGHQRGHGALYDAVNAGRIDISRLRRSLAGLPLPRAADGRLMLAVDVSNWLRPGAATSPQRLFCHVYGRSKGQAQMIPGWPYSVIAALEPGRTSWTAVLDAVRLGPDDDGPLPVIEGTLIRLQVDHLPGDRDPKPVWLWCSAAGAPPAEVDRLSQAFLRRFDLERSKPRCCHNRVPASLLAPCCPVFMSAV